MVSVERMVRQRNDKLKRLVNDLAARLYSEEQISEILKETSTLDTQIDKLVHDYLRRPGSEREILDPVNVQAWVRKRGGVENPSTKYFLACVDVGVSSVVRNYRNYVIFVMQKRL